MTLNLVIQYAILLLFSGLISALDACVNDAKIDNFHSVQHLNKLDAWHYTDITHHRHHYHDSGGHRNSHVGLFEYGPSQIHPQPSQAYFASIFFVPHRVQILVRFFLRKTRWGCWIRATGVDIITQLPFTPSNPLTRRKWGIPLSLFKPFPPSIHLRWLLFDETLNSTKTCILCLGHIGLYMSGKIRPTLCSLLCGKYTKTWNPSLTEEVPLAVSYLSKLWNAKEDKSRATHPPIHPTPWILRKNEMEIDS